MINLVHIDGVYYPWLNQIELISLQFNKIVELLRPCFTDEMKYTG